MSYWDGIDDINTNRSSITTLKESNINNINVDYFSDIRNELLMESMSIDVLSEEFEDGSLGKWLSTTNPSEWFGGWPTSAFNTLKGWFVGNAANGSKGLAGLIGGWKEGGGENAKLAGSGIKGMLNGLSDFMTKNPNFTTATLAGAGLLGTYYLAKKMFNKKDKKATPEELKTAVKLDNMNQSQIASQHIV